MNENTNVNVNNNMTNCPSCGEMIAKSAKSCPKCGAKMKKPWYKKWWVWVIAVIVIAGIGNSSQSSKTQEAPMQSANPSQQGEGDGSGQAAPAQPTEGENQAVPASEPVKKADVEIIGDTTVEGDDFSKYICGTIQNNTDKKYSYVQVTFNLYDAEGNQIGTALDNINNLEAGGTWKFKAVSFESDFASYKLSDIEKF